MAFTEFHYYSETLEIDVSVNVILPETRIMAQQEGKPLPTLYLLHGLSDDHTHWVRQTRLEFYARKYRLAIIMPCVNRSFYTDMKRGAKYFTFVSEELPRVMEMYFPLSSRREDRFAAGLSMGGYGATKLGLRLPEKYAAIASLSGALEMENDYHMRKMRDSDRLYQELLNIFGTEEEFLASDNCLTRLAEQLDPAKAPRKSSWHISAARRTSCLAPTRTSSAASAKSSPSTTPPKRARPTRGTSGIARSRRFWRG